MGEKGKGTIVVDILQSFQLNSECANQSGQLDQIKQPFI